MRVLLFSKYEDLGPSSRLRSYQYLPMLKNEGIEIEVSPLFSNQYVKCIYGTRGFRLLLLALNGYIKRFFKLFNANKYDLVWIEKELFPWLPPFAELLLTRINRPYLVDFDDAVFHRYDQSKYYFIRLALGNKIDRIMKNATEVIVGNQYLYERARKAEAKSITIIPTAVNVNAYLPLKEYSSEVFTIGWIGTPVTAKYIASFNSVFKSLIAVLNYKLLLIGVEGPNIDGIDLEYRKWELNMEAELLKECDVGIMPLEDSLWEKGKCGYKLIQYMACGLPVIASPVGVNCSIVDSGINGFLASTEEEWIEAFIRLEADEKLRKKMGLAGRKKVECEYSIKVTAKQLTGIIEGAVSVKEDRER